jgi:AraC-like DNA-binding protein
MLFRSYKPRAPLGEFVEDIWLYRNYVGEHARERILPSGTFEIVFNLQEDELRIYGPEPQDRCRRYAGAVVSGPYGGSFMSDAAEETSILGVHFKPGGAFPLLGISAGEFANTHVDLRAVWGPSAVALREQLCALSRPKEQILLLERALLTRLVDLPRRHGAVRHALDLLARTGGQAMVRDVARAVDLSQRRLIVVFVNEVGLRPKQFGRVQRFQRALALTRNIAKADWAELATACGYFDQAHLIHEFVEFSGVAPADYWRRQRQLDDAAVHVKRHHLPLAE